MVSMVGWRSDAIVGAQGGSSLKRYETGPREKIGPIVEPPVEEQYTEEYISVEEEAHRDSAHVEEGHISDGDVQVDTGDDAVDESEIVADDINSTRQGTLVVLSQAPANELPSQTPVYKPPFGERLLAWAPFLGIILLGGILRFWGLGDKPLHHDESLHAYFSLQLMHNMEAWLSCFNPNVTCYRYDPLLHGPFQFHFIALTYKISQLLGAPDNGVNTTTVRILAATLGTLIVALPYFLRDYLGKWGALLACFILAVSPSMVYFSRFAREDIYMACFTLLLVVSVARYIRDRKIRWLILAALAFSLSYATKEATFLSIAVFGSFLGALIAWEIGVRWQIRSRFNSETAPWYIPRTAASVAVLVYFVILGLVAKFFFGWLKALSIYVTDPKNTPAADLYVQGLKDKTVGIVPWLGILLGCYVLFILGREMLGRLPPPGRRGLAAKVDAQHQPVLDTILTMPWTHWFFAVLVAWTVFLVLFTVLFTNIKNGIGDGIWQGLYYWIQQQQVARGGQPWYYYLLLIPLYEQIGVVFGLIGVVRCILRPTRFRLFLVYWFVGNLFIYSWAAEKMPWLSIHITMPMLLLAAIGLEPALVTLVNLVKNSLSRSSKEKVPALVGESSLPVIPVTASRKQVGVFAGFTAFVGVVMAALLLLPTLHNMYEVTYVHSADGPHEMLVYVQTTIDVNTVMAKVDALDQKLYNGKHLLPIGLMNDATWPFAWYVRDYTNVCFNYPDGCSATAKTYPVIITGGDNLYNSETQYAGPGKNYLFNQYHMRTWWDEGYKPLPCVTTKTNNCTGQPTWGGVGVGLWLSYGDNPPHNAKFDPGLAAQHIWQWWWDRRAIGDTGGTYDMALFIQKGLGETP
jgi:predicted membrane-bound mannosyltransferase